MPICIKASSSCALIISGIDATTTISINQGYYSINNATSTNANGVVKNGDVVKIFIHSGINFGTTVTITLTIGNRTADFIVITENFSLDIDGNGKIEDQTDMLLLMRYLLGITKDNELIANAIATNATRNSADDIKRYLNAAQRSLIIDVDGNGIVDASDGFLLVKFANPASE